MKKRYCFSIAVLITALVLEILPYGAVLNWAVAPESGGGTNRVLYSYFDLTTFGVGNFGPLPTALLTVLVLAFVMILLAVKKPVPKLNTAAFALCCAALIFSLMPILIPAVSVIGIIISALLLTAAVFLNFAKQNNVI